MLKSALNYLQAGFSVIPLIPGEKKPKIPWEEFQKRKSTEAEVREWWSKWPHANIGVVTGAISGIWVIDLDRYKENFSHETELEYFDSIITPTVMTPRGGNHLWFLAPDEPASGGELFPGIDLRAEGNYIVSPPSQNGSGKRYAWVEGLELPNVGLAAPSVGLLKKIYNKDTNSFYTHGVTSDITHNTSQASQIVTDITRIYTLGRRDEDLFHLAHVLVKHRCHPDFIRKTLEIVALNCNPPFPLGEVEVKIESAMKRAKDKDRNIMSEVREFVDVTKGHFSITEASHYITCVTKQEKHALRVALGRLADEKLIERVGKGGAYRVIDKDEELIDFESPNMTPYNIKLPLGITKWVRIYGGNLIVIAGESNSGKTAFCLNVAIDNAPYHRINYMSSEMQDGVELRMRLDKFRLPLNAWKPVKFQFRTDGFPDKIDPDGLNIVDYLDEGSEGEAYKMAGRLRDITNALKTGIAVVAIQKDPNKEFGFGGSSTINRSRLYLTITNKNILTIKKAKSWADDMVNPNGIFCRFKLGGGCHFKIDGDWNK